MKSPLPTQIVFHTHSLIGPKIYGAGTNNIDISAILAVTRENLFISVMSPKNLHLSTTSRAIAGAAATGDVTMDFEGHPRPAAGADIGADEVNP
jgi:hypothetical protein